MQDLFGEIPETVRYRHLDILLNELQELRKEVRALTIKAGLPDENTDPEVTDEGRDEYEIDWE
ncbi:hypothetical protein ACFQRB_19045 [Halobaculum litoreum]|uniref:Uncharacterized protein n=1 Tax=Halobaculum litoreum TaxID=3031998 RepID=A0ABD5XS83_9EURY